MGLSGGKLIHKRQNDTFTSNTSGTTCDVSTVPLKFFTLGVTATGPVLSWEVILEGSINGTNFTTILTHTSVLVSGTSVFSGVLHSPALYFRTRCVSVVLGVGTNIVVNVLGSQ